MAAEQLTKGTNERSTLFGVSFINTNLAVADITDTSEHVAAKGLELFFLKAYQTERSDAEDTIEEINGIQGEVVNGEIRITFATCIDKSDWTKLKEYNAFSCGQAYLYMKNGEVAYRTDGDATTPTALGLPLNMVKAMKDPIFTDGSAAAKIQLQVNIDAELLKASPVLYATLDAPVDLLCS